ncbi:ATP-binding protein [Saccharothrix sp.]|uniref:ATP-binding protein n=1 Tax=Saccharothrix sp. TaxID=1873460 RepID=UPI00281117B7|nr:ATP-binding protein [Saccharothrix sp.]
MTPADPVGPRVAALVRDLAARAGLDRARAYRLRLASDEIATNAVTHGGVDTVSLCGGLDDTRVWVVVEDNAPPFDPRTYDPEVVLTDPHEREPGGLGLFLAHSGVDELHYERTANRNRTTLVIHRELSVPGGNPESSVPDGTAELSVPDASAELSVPGGTMEPGAGGRRGTGG